MLVRRLALVTFAVLLIPGGASATGGPSSVERPDSLSRDDILAGRASQAQQRRALQASIELAGGESVEVVGSQRSGLGGYGQALVAADLDGDGDEEILLEQYVGPRRFLLAADDNGVIWRQRIDRGPWFAGYLIDDFAAGGGDEVLLIAHEWLGKAGQRVSIIAVNKWGLLWIYEPHQAFHEINGSVQADGDERAELAITTWSDAGNPRLVTLDGDVGWELRTLKGTLDVDTAAFDTSSQTFVTDGAAGQSDEAVFITSLPVGGGYFAERLRLTDGTRTDFEVLPQLRLGTILQGRDYTGDGRRDAFVDDYDAFGVFDPIAFTAWRHEHGLGSMGYGQLPDPVGDLDGDGGEDLCVVLTQANFMTQFQYELTGHIDCRSGKIGTRIWTATTPTVRVAGGNYAYPFGITRHDLDGDGHPDPVIGVHDARCDLGCETTRFEMSALQGKTGASLWAVNDPSADDLLWKLTEGNLDDVPGDDLFEADEDSDAADFRVLNGLTMQPSWSGVVEPDSDYGHVLDWGHGDVDGDGVTEAVVTAYATYRTCGPGPWCHWDTDLLLAAFSGQGELLWQIEL